MFPELLQSFILKPLDKWTVYIHKWSPHLSKYFLLNFDKRLYFSTSLKICKTENNFNRLSKYGTVSRALD